MGGHPLRQAAVFAVWLVMVATTVDFGLFRLPATGWAVVGLQVCGYALLIAPVAIWSPRTFRCLALPGRQALVGAVLVAAALVDAVLGQHLSNIHLAENSVKYLATGVGEEVAFRGFLWERTQAAGLAPVWLVAVNTVVFTAWHLDSVAAQQSQLSDLIGVAVFGLLFTIIRLWSGNVGLPALVHIASDIAGV